MIDEKTELVESICQAGELVSCGNGMQFSGIILIKSQCSLEDLNDYYNLYRKNVWDYVEYA